MSTKSGRAPACEIASVVAMKVSGTVHGVSSLHARRHQRKPQAVRAAGHSHAEPRVAELRELALELLDHCASDEARGVECGLEHRAQLLPELAVNSDKIEEGNLTRAHSMPLVW